MPTVNVGETWVHTSTNEKVVIHDPVKDGVICYRMMDGGLNWMHETMFHTVFHKAIQRIETKRCQFCGEREIIEINATNTEVNRWLNGELIQNMWPTMPVPIREQLISGTHPKCWDENMKEENL